MILVTGATGRMGGAVLRHWGGRSRSGARSGTPVEGADEAAVFDFEDPATHCAALKGCTALFLMRPPAITVAAPFREVMRAAKAAGIRHVVCASVYGAGESRVLPHRHMEAAVRESGLAHTFLRPADFMQNLADVHGEAIRERGEIAVPAGKGRSAFVDVEDVGRAAAAVFADPEAHSGRGYDLTGPEALSFADVARVLSEVLGESVRYRPVSVPGFVFREVRAGRTLSMTLVMTALYTVQRLGRAAPVSGGFRRLTRRAPSSLVHYAEREAELFTRPQPRPR